MAPRPDPAYGPQPGRLPAAGPIGRRWRVDGSAGMVARPVARQPEGSGSDRRVLHRRIRLVRRHLGPGPYLHFGCDRGALLALLAARGSASGFVADAALAEIARAAAPGCPVHTNPDAIPVGVFRGVLTTGPADDAALAVWRRVLVRGGRVLMIAASGGGDGDDCDGGGGGGRGRGGDGGGRGGDGGDDGCGGDGGDDGRGGDGGGGGGDGGGDGGDDGRRWRRWRRRGRGGGATVAAVAVATVAAVAAATVAAVAVATVAAMVAATVAATVAAVAVATVAAVAGVAVATVSTSRRTGWPPRVSRCGGRAASGGGPVRPSLCWRRCRCRHRGRGEVSPRQGESPTLPRRVGDSCTPGRRFAAASSDTHRSARGEAVVATTSHTEGVLARC